jgi:hypothetical protein
MLILRALLLGPAGRGAVIGEHGMIWHGMSGLAVDVRLQEPRIERAAIRRAVRSLERGGLVDVKRGRALVDSDTGRKLGHAQNLVRVSERGRDYLSERLAQR